MGGIRDQENIEALKQRLYDRGSGTEKVVRHRLTDAPVDVARGWSGMPSRPVGNQSVPTPAPQPEPQPRASVSEPEPIVTEAIPTTLPPEPIESNEVEALPQVAKRGRFRNWVLLGSFVIFILTALVTSIYLFFGSNQISANNINLTLNAPFAQAGGDIANLQLTLSNQNSVPIESAILTLNYPSGTRSAEEGGRELFEERIPIPSVGAGEVVNLPLRVVLFGEENEEKIIRASIEYRVGGSNGLFFREATPQVVKISSSPLVMRVVAVDKISSGQQAEVKVELRSNAAAAQRNVLLSASYPNTFQFVRSDPAPSYAQNGWILPEVRPGETYTITIVGKVDGALDEQGEWQFTAGNPRTDNQFLMGSVLAQARTQYTIERPFTTATIAINGNTSNEVVLAPGQDAEVSVRISNALSEPIYNLRVEVAPRGNLIRTNRLYITEGLYDSTTQMIRYEESGQSALARLGAGEMVELRFGVRADPGQQTAAFSVTANLYAQRANNASSPEMLVGTATAEVKYASSLTLGRQAGYGDGPFTDTGAVPPVAGLATTYTVTLRTEGGVNDATGAVVTTSLPQYVDWREAVAGDGEIEYNSTSKQIRWNIGDIPARTSRTTQFQVSLLPSATQVGRTVVLIGEQDLRATDRFTNTPLTANAEALSTELSSEFGFVSGNGIIQPPL